MNKLSVHIKDNILKYIAGILCLVMTSIGGYLWNLTQIGAEVEFNEKVDKRFIKKMTDPETLRWILTTPEIEDFTTEATDKLRKDITKRIMDSDSARISSRDFIGVKTGIRTDSVLPYQARILRDYIQGKLMRVEDVEKLIKKRVKREAMKPNRQGSTPEF